MKCPTPFYKLDAKVGDYIAFPCGQCYECKMRRVNSWAFRLQHEFNQAHDAHFVTFTYNTDSVPINEHGQLTLDKRHFQLFMKRLRKISNYPGHKIKYFACGEYGDQTARPHYHGIIFNAKLDNIEKEWRLGSIHRGNVESASIYYTLKYMMKRKAPKQWWKQPEFQLISNGLGAGYLTPTNQAWHKADLEGRYYLPLYDGIKCPLPRYYKDQIYSQEERQAIGQTILNSIPPAPVTITKEDMVYSSMIKSDRNRKNKSVL